MDIVEIGQARLMTEFYELFAETECGPQFKRGNRAHAAWLNKRADCLFLSGARAFELRLPPDTPAGFILVVPQTKLDGLSFTGLSAEITDIAIFPQFRRRGYGTELLRYTEIYVKEKNIEVLYVSTTATMLETIVFYLRNGYIPAAVLSDMYGINGDGILYLCKRLLNHGA